jgi:pimeloyl-ACP methyl ester carboxylesterase
VDRSPARNRRGRTGWAPRLALLALLGTGWGFIACVSVPPTAAAATAVRSAAPGERIPRQQVLRRALRADPSQEYLLYVPTKGGQGAPIFVTAHGISRNVEEHATLFAPYAERQGAVLVAPYFTPEEHDDYQRLGRKGRGRRADMVLDAILEEVEALTGASAGKFYLFGFSGGAQFAHRYAMAHPERVAGVAVGAAGWYTFPDSETPYPYGLGPSEELAGVRFDPREFLRVPITVFVGEADVGSQSLRRNPQVDRQQGVTRLERAQNWTSAMRRAALARGQEPLTTCELVPGIGHSFRQFMLEGGLGDRVFGALFGSAHEAAPRPDRPVQAQPGTGSR